MPRPVPGTANANRTAMLPIRYVAFVVVPLATACVWKAGGPEIAAPRVDGSIVSASEPPPAQPDPPKREVPARAPEAAETTRAPLGTAARAGTDAAPGRPATHATDVGEAKAAR
jgi:hypothetical protein